jgi:ATPase subunit of ABC transporter with duplicated ATPase domains
MSILNIENLTFSFGDKVILKNASFRLLRGEHIGIVGANGAGKTTFLNIINGKYIPDKGTLYRSPSINLGHLDQHLELDGSFTIRETLKLAFTKLYSTEKQIIEIGDMLTKTDTTQMDMLLKKLGSLQDSLYSSDFYRIDSIIDNVANGLGLSALGMDTIIEKLSGGQRTKVKLARLLLENSDILLLDEPTNYLDKEHIDWLTEYLSSYDNSFIVISHDTGFLNKVTNVIYNIEFTNMKRYPGNYETFLKLKDEESKRYIEEYTRQQEQIKKLEDFVNKNIVRASTTKRAQSRRKQLEKIDRLEKPKLQAAPSFSFILSRESGRLVFESSNLNIGYSYPIINDLNLTLKKGEKIAVTGCNGIGKSTLLKTIMGILSPLAGIVNLGEYLNPVYFEQESQVNNNTALVEVWEDFPNKSQREIREALAKCGLKQEHILQPMNALSGGEQSKVRLCKLMMTPGNWLLLDEPTNHLDIYAKESLKEALIKFKGTVLLVCHEEDFYADWVTNVWNLETFIN